MPDGRQPDPSTGAGHSPSEPRPDRRGARDFGAGYDRPARLQMVVALLLGLVLVAIPLYLWRRPRAESPIVAAQADAEAAPLAALDLDASAADDAGAAVALTEPKILECHDPGSKHTPAEQCDHLTDFEKLFGKAIQDAASCAPSQAQGGGALPFVADVSFGRKKGPIHLGVGKDGRTLKSPKTAAACVAAVKKNLAPVTLDGMKHEHSRYKIAITATYAGK